MEAKDCTVYNQYCYYLLGNDVNNFNTIVHYISSVFHNSLNITFFTTFGYVFLLSNLLSNSKRDSGLPLASLTTTCP